MCVVLVRSIVFVLGFVYFVLVVHVGLVVSTGNSSPLSSAMLNPAHSVTFTEMLLLVLMNSLCSHLHLQDSTHYQKTSQLSRNAVSSSKPITTRCPLSQQDRFEVKRSKFNFTRLYNTERGYSWMTSQCKTTISIEAWSSEVMNILKHKVNDWCLLSQAESLKEDLDLERSRQTPNMGYHVDEG